MNIFDIMDFNGEWRECQKIEAIAREILPKKSLFYYIDNCLCIIPEGEKFDMRIADCFISIEDRCIEKYAQQLAEAYKVREKKDLFVKMR